MVGQTLLTRNSSSFTVEYAKCAFSAVSASLEAFVRGGKCVTEGTWISGFEHLYANSIFWDEAFDGVGKEPFFDQVALLLSSWVFLTNSASDGAVHVVGKLIDGVLETMEHGFDGEGASSIAVLVKRLLNAPINIFLLNAPV
jgi:hypothetical protein